MRSVLLTGTSTGIGRACAELLAADGWTVFAGVRRSEDGDRLKTEVTGDVRPVILDVSKPDDVARVVAELETELGDRGLQGLVNNAGVGVGGPFEFLEEDDWRWVFEVNLFGVVRLTKAALPLLERGRGCVVHIGSVGGRIASPGLGPYSASKFALEAVAESQRHEFARGGVPVRVALVEPGGVRTAIWDKGEADVEAMEQKLDDRARARYGWMIAQMRGFIEDGRRRGVSPRTVARVVAGALTAERPRPRYLVGRDAKIAGNLVTRLPDRLRERALDLNARTWERHARRGPSC
jgi:NAD(P)-dependent dehydrogenase (short-subunit alcohol dehydrogenase family)